MLKFTCVLRYVEGDMENAKDASSGGGCGGGGDKNKAKKQDKNKTPKKESATEQKPKSPEFDSVIEGRRAWRL